MARSWVCYRQIDKRRCLARNPRVKQKCEVCGGPRPKPRKAKHLVALEMPYEHYIELNGGERCGVCLRPRSEADRRRLDRDHDHRTGRPRMTPAQTTVLRALRGHCFNGPECHPSQDLLARQTGYTREYINRIIRQLHHAGHLTVRKERRAGCKWQHNIYTLAVWSPPLRSRTMERIRAAKRRVHTEGNPKPSQRVQPRSFARVRGCRTEAVVARARVTNPIQLIRTRLDANGCQPRGPVEKFSARCPAHDDRQASLGVKEADDARVLLNCLAGCQPAEVVAALGLEMRDLFVPPTPGVYRAPRKRKPLRRRRSLPASAWPIDRVLLRHAPNYRATAAPNFWTAVCKVCGGEMWIHAELDTETESMPSGPVTLRCVNGCITNVRGRRV